MWVQYNASQSSYIFYDPTQQQQQQQQWQKKKKKHLLDYALIYQNDVSKTKMKQMTTPNLVLAPKELQLTGLH